MPAHTPISRDWAQQIDGEPAKQDPSFRIERVGDQPTRAIERCPDKLRAHLPLQVDERVIGAPRGAVEIAAGNRARKNAHAIPFSA